MKYIIYREGKTQTQVAALFDRSQPLALVRFIDGQEPIAAGYVSFEIVCGEINPICYPMPQSSLPCNKEYDAAIVLESMTRR